MILQLKTHIKGKSAKGTLKYIDNNEKNVVDRVKYLGFSNCECRNIKDFNIHLQNQKEQYQCLRSENSKANFANHWILSFSDEESENLDLKKVYLYAQEFCKKAFPNNTCCFTIHTDTEHTHIHIVQSCYSQNDNSKYRDTKAERKKIFELSNSLSKEMLNVKTLEEYKKEKENQKIKIETGTKNYKKYTTAKKEDYADKFPILEEIYKNSISLTDFKEKCKESNIQIEERIRRGKVSSYIYIIENKKYTSSKFEKDILNPEQLQGHFEMIEINKRVEELKEKERKETEILEEMRKQRQKQQTKINETNKKPINLYIPNAKNVPNTLKDLLKTIKFIDEVKDRLQNQELKNQLEKDKKEYEETYKYFIDNKNVSNEVVLRDFDKVLICMIDYERQDENFKKRMKDNHNHLERLYYSQDYIEQFKDLINNNKSLEPNLKLNFSYDKDYNKNITELINLSKDNSKDKYKTKTKDYFEK